MLRFYQIMLVLSAASRRAAACQFMQETPTVVLFTTVHPTLIVAVPDDIFRRDVAGCLPMCDQVTWDAMNTSPSGTGSTTNDSTDQTTSSSTDITSGNSCNSNEASCTDASGSTVTGTGSTVSTESTETASSESNIESSTESTETASSNPNTESSTESTETVCTDCSSDSPTASCSTPFNSGLVTLALSSISQFSLQDYCSLFLSYDTPVTTTTTEVVFNPTLTTTSTQVAETVTETSSYLLLTITDIETIYSPVSIPGGRHMHIRQESLTIPSILRSFCIAEISAACALAITSPIASITTATTMLTINYTQLVIETTTASTTEIILMATTTSTTTTFAYRGIARFWPNTGRYIFWYMYWPEASGSSDLFFENSRARANYFTLQYVAERNAYYAYTPSGLDPTQDYYMTIHTGDENAVSDWSVKLLRINDILANPNLQLLYLDYNMFSYVISVKDTRGGNRSAMYACEVLINGQRMVQFRVYNIGSALVPSSCEFEETLNVSGF